MRRIIWTHERRKDLYTKVIKEVGAFSTWTGARAPLSKKEKYDALLWDLSDQFRRETGEIISPAAVEQQIDWAITKQKEMKDQSHVRNFILNKAAALEVGFLSTADLPGYMHVRPE